MSLFFFNDTATTEIYTLSLHDALPILGRGEFTIHRLGQHDVLDDGLLGYAELLRLLRDLLVDERRAHEARAYDIRTNPMSGAFLGNHLGEPDEAVLGGDIGRLEHRGLLRMH